MEAEERNEAEYGKDLSHTQRNWYLKGTKSRALQRKILDVYYKVTKFDAVFTITRTVSLAVAPLSSLTVSRKV